MTSDNKVFVGGLSPATTRETLLQQMSIYGDIKDCKVIMDQQTGKSKGYGFVCQNLALFLPFLFEVVYTTPQQAEASVKQGYVMVDGKNCNCNLASLRKKEKTDSTGSVCNIPSDLQSGLGIFNDLGFDRSRTDLMMAPPAYMPIAMDPQMHMSASLQSLFAEFQTLKYEVSLINQNILQLKQTISIMKTGLDSLLQRNGIIVTSYSQ
eukprot:TRINITY_DN6518_c0_g1_i1.p1 TRINITY_DN6518_c0_g1~~TRINITY_DN6518_c0_g1_i1.p1  ORF type:complete len:208 (+),score=27.60 TRINITY_DN6518_c0_g1_i1:181-804(+)